MGGRERFGIYPSEGVKSLGKCPRRIGLVSQGLVVHRLSGAVNQLLSRRRTCSRRRPQAIARHRRRLRGPQPLLGVTRPVGGWAALLRRSPIRLDSPPDSASCIAFVETDAANDDRPRALCFSPHEQAGVPSITSARHPCSFRTVLAVARNPCPVARPR